MGAQEVELVRRIYGFDWVGVSSRKKGFAELTDLVDPDFRSQFSPELGERIIEGVDGLERFTQALEQDFSEFRYDPEEFIDGADGSVVVLGQIHAQGRSSRMPLTGEFGHVWAVRDGRAAAVTAYRDRRSARNEAGLT
jgi:ketosteroid isomerase-like protein